ncbi:hypothetical protein ACWC1D_31520 [Streptomyces sp. NPDC001478]
MTQNRTSFTSSARAFTSSRRALLTATGLAAALALTGCGTETHGGAAKDAPRARSVADASAAQPSAEQAAFEKMLDTFGRQCPAPGGDPVAPPVPEPVEPEPEVAPGGTPPAAPFEPGVTPGPETELNPRDWCTGANHAQRLIVALQEIDEPTPATVRAALNRLGYIDAHIHGLRQDETGTRFHLDLRESGGRLCAAGLAAGRASDATACVAGASGPFRVEWEEQS